MLVSADVKEGMFADEGLYLGETKDKIRFIDHSIAIGGVFGPHDEETGMQPFIPWHNIEALWFDDDKEEE